MSIIDLDPFLKTEGVTFDVRSPAEFVHAHLPGAYSLPIFDNEERALIGTCYKNEGEKPATLLGIKIIGPKMGSLVEEAQKHAQGGPAKVYCWRGGMRSQSFSQLLQVCGIQTETLNGGYKTFRQAMLQQLQQPIKIFLLGGMTGTGKTEILQVLKEKGEQVLDLEALANHRGSTYGKHNTPQPSNESFENQIGYQLSQINSTRPVWIEAESRLIGRCKIPDALFQQMRSAPLIAIERPIEERMEVLKKEYGNTDLQLLIESTIGIERRLGSERTKSIVTQLKNGDYQIACKELLSYYDKSYLHAMKRRQPPLHSFSQKNLSNEEWASQLINSVSLEQPIMV